MKKHYIISDSGSIIGFTKEDYEMLPEKSRKLFEELGNHFETKKEAELAVNKLKAWKRLKDKNFHFLKYSALGCGEIEFSLDFEDMDDEGEIGELQADLDLLFGGENNG